jgi:hypothetical protein
MINRVSQALEVGAVTGLEAQVANRGAASGLIARLGAEALELLDTGL